LELDTAYKDAGARRAKLDASERADADTKLIEAASVPKEPWRPPYWRDTGIALAGSLLLALLAMWLVEIFNRAEPQPAVVMFQSQPSGVSYDAERPGLLGQGAPMPLERAAPTLLSQPAPLPRELDADEIAALLRASTAAAGSSCSSSERYPPRRGHRPDGWRRRPRAGRFAGRRVRTRRRASDACAPHRAAHEAQGRSPAGLAGRAMTRDALDAQVLCAAHDAALYDPAAITADCLRHTYVAYLVRQGYASPIWRGSWVPCPRIYSGRTPLGAAGQRVPRESIDTCSREPAQARRADAALFGLDPGRADDRRPAVDFRLEMVRKPSGVAFSLVTTCAPSSLIRSANCGSCNPACNAATSFSNTGFGVPSARRRRARRRPRTRQARLRQRRKSFSVSTRVADVAPYAFTRPARMYCVVCVV
jgi:hypothetical protein